MSTIHERIADLIKTLERGNQSDFARRIGVSASTVHSAVNKSEPGFALLSKIAETYPAINTDWLLTGKGGMFKVKETSQTNTIQGNVGNLAGRDIVYSLEQEVRHLKERLNDKEHIIELLRMKH